jgi:acetoin utilization deacetylase AcuC-like enzyme
MPSQIGIVFDHSFLHHEAAASHPERPDRLVAIERGLNHRGLLASCQRLLVTPAADERLTRVHDAAYIERLREACAAGRLFIDSMDSGICPDSERVARNAAGAVADAALAVVDGRVRRAFCAVRPPGHHAERGLSMGFCLFNNVAVAASAAIAERGLNRVAILDWDVHHGNGTQHIFEDDPRVLFVSLHGHPLELYPGTGFEHETGVGAGKGFTVNVPIHAGTGDDEYLEKFRSIAIARIRDYQPELLIISAGFDAHAADPLGTLTLSDAAFDNMTRLAAEAADSCCDGRILSVLEGGYDLGVLERCVAAHVVGLG